MTDNRCASSGLARNGSAPVTKLREGVTKMGRLSREAGGLGDYSENANDNEGGPELTEDEAAQVDELADEAEAQPELPDEDEPA